MVDRARAEDISVSEWVTRAVENELNRSRLTQIIPPGFPAKPAVTLEAVQVATAALQVMLSDHAGRVTRAAVRSACSTIQAGMREARGLRPVYRDSDTRLLDGKPG